MSTKKPKSKKIPAETVVAETEELILEAPVAIETALPELEIQQAAASPDIAEPAAGKKRKAAKTKVIRDSFSFPEHDYRKISELKKACLSAGAHVKKGEILRAGLHLLSRLEISELTQVLEQVEKVKTGRPNISK